MVYRFSCHLSPQVLIEDHLILLCVGMDVEDVHVPRILIFNNI
jgi:hypothetical protein